jgi:hypothetical protein
MSENALLPVPSFVKPKSTEKQIGFYCPINKDISFNINKKRYKHMVAMAPKPNVIEANYEILRPSQYFTHKKIQWCRQALARDKAFKVVHPTDNDVGYLSIVGALQRAYYPHKDTRHQIGKSIWRLQRLLGVKSIWLWEESYGRSIEEVIDAMQRVERY